MLIPLIVLPFDYESITNCRKKNNEYSLIKQDLRVAEIADTLFLCEKANKQGVFDPRTQKWLLPLIYDAIYKFGDSLFLVSYDEKWQFMNQQGQKVLAETFDYSGTLSTQHPFNQDEWITNCFVIKNDSMFFYSETSFPNRSHLNDIKENNSSIKQQTPQRFHVKSESDHSDWYIDPNGKVFIAPDFQQIWEKDSIIVIRNPITNQQQIIDKQGNKQSFLSQYKIENMNIQDNWVLVRDTVTKRLGMMTVDQKVILPAQFLGMAHSERHPVIWARADHPNLDSIKHRLNSNYKLNPLDSNWQLYDATGKLLTSVIFDYPFEWEHSVAVGQVRRKQGLWNHKGHNILPATYDAIWYDSFSHIFHLFKMQPDSSYRIGFANGDGQVVIDAVLFNMSIFTKNDAFVETENGY